uniref:O-antigen ligase family protein n=1 Tax=Candidatus Desulfatibia profunda TaxID=2841695 RepID=A0A8J6TIA0_9BACT|nr:O-antigen ligase family protein [Candidatus Desulfatibia profunda]
MNNYLQNITRYLQNVPRYALYALLIFTPLARACVQDWAVTTIHLITLIALTAFLLEKSLTWSWNWIKTPLDKPIFILIILSILSTIFSLHRHTSFWSIILLFNYLTIFYLIIHTINSRSHLRRLIYLVIGIAVFLSVFGLFKHFDLNPFPWWNYTDLKNAYIGRLTSTFGCPNNLAGYLEMAIPFVLGLCLTGYRGAWLFLMIYIFLLLLTALVLTLSRGGWISGFLGLSFMAFALITSRDFRRKRLLAALIGGSLALVLIVLASTPVIERIRTVMEKEQEASFHSRVMVWREAVKMIADHPLMGTGPGTFGVINTQYQPPGLVPHFEKAHNDYLHFIAEIGIAVIPVMLWMIIALYKKGFHKLKNPSRLIRSLTLGSLAGITAILFHSVVDFNLHIPANALLFTVLVAIVASPIPTDR